MKPLYKLILTITIGSAVFVGGFFVFHYNTPALQQINIIDSDNASTVPDGFMVTEMGDGQRKIESPDGFSVVVDESIYSRNDNGVLVLQDYVETDGGVGGPQGCINDVKATPDSAQVTIDSYIDYCKNDISCESSSVENVEINGTMWKKIIFSGGFVGSGWPSYVTENKKGSVIINFSCSDILYHKEILSQFYISK